MPGQAEKLCIPFFMTLVREPKKYDPTRARWERSLWNRAEQCDEASGAVRRVSYSPK